MSESNKGPSKPTLDRTTHHLLEFRHPGDAIIELRRLLLLPENRDLHDKAKVHPTFETVLGQIAADLFIVLDDGMYDADKLVLRLVEAIRLRSKVILHPTTGLQN